MFVLVYIKSIKVKKSILMCLKMERKHAIKKYLPQDPPKQLNELHLSTGINNAYHVFILWAYTVLLSFSDHRRWSMAPKQPGQSLQFNPLSPDIKMHILLTVLHTFLMELVRRICLNIKTPHPWWSLSLFSSHGFLNK